MGKRRDDRRDRRDGKPDQIEKPARAEKEKHREKPKNKHLKAAKEQNDHSDAEKSDVSRDEYNNLLDKLKTLQEAKDVQENTQSESGSRRSRSKDKRKDRENRKADRYKDEDRHHSRDRHHDSRERRRDRYDDDRHAHRRDDHRDDSRDRRRGGRRDDDRDRDRNRDRNRRDNRGPRRRDSRRSRDRRRKSEEESGGFLGSLMSKETMGLLGSVAVPAVTSLLKGEGPPKSETPNGETANEGKPATEKQSPMAGGIAGLMDNVLPGASTLMNSLQGGNGDVPDLGNMMGMMKDMVKSGDQSGLPGLAGMVGLAGDLSKSDNPMKTITMGMLKTQLKKDVDLLMAKVDRSKTVEDTQAQLLDLKYKIDKAIDSTINGVKLLNLK